MIPDYRYPDSHSKPAGSSYGSRIGSRDSMGSSYTQPAYRRVDLKTITGIVSSGWYARYKYAGDIALGILLAFLLLPVALVAALIVKATSPGPVLYSQTRLGLFAVPFRIFKFRSMRHNVEKQSGAKWASRNDSRVTPIGKILRITHLDELPQLVNVLLGEMSLVGPRPERPEFIPALEQTVDHYRLRMLVKPGVTGLAQVYLPPDVDVSSVQKKVVYDLYYIRHFSFWLDLRIVIATPLQAIGVPCSLVRFLLWLPSEKTIENDPLPAEFESLNGREKNPSMNPSQTMPDSHAYPLSDSKFGTSVAV